MKIFFSYSSRDMPLLREIPRYFPVPLDIWMDEMEVPPGKNFSESIRTEIQSGDNLVVFFFSPEAVKSKWVKKELKWATDSEKKLRKRIIIPVLLEENCWTELPKRFQERKYLLCTNFTKFGVQSFSHQLYNELLVCFLTLLDNASEEVIKKRKEEVRKIASAISNDQSTATGRMKLTRPCLKKIISMIDPKNKLILLAMNELEYGKFSKVTTDIRPRMAPFLTIEFELPGKRRWIHKFEWESDATFRSLNFDYGLGHHNVFVRNVFLEGIANLEEEERDILFSEIDIIDISSHR